MTAKRDLLIHLLDCLEEATGCTFIWKATAALIVQFSLPEKHRRHVQPFCLCVKGMGRDLEISCMRNDMEQISRRALEQRSAFVNICHAGVAELIVPIFHGDHYLGAILCGPFISADCGCIYPETAMEFSRLPQLTESRATALAEMVERVMQDAHSAMGADEVNDRELPELEHIEDLRIREAMNFMREKFRRSITVGEIAQRNSLSKSRFLHLFKEQAGMSFSEYLQRLRIGEACRLLVGTGLRMGEIADACGISDQSRLAALFKRYYHFSPMAYRRRNNNNKMT